MRTLNYLTRLQAEWVSWAIDGMKDSVLSSESGYQWEDIPNWRSHWNMIHFRNMNAWVDFRDRILVQAEDMIDQAPDATRNQRQVLTLLQRKIQAQEAQS